MCPTPGSCCTRLQEITTPAGQWKFASAALRQSWAAANPAAAAAAADGTEFTEPLPDTETGKLPYALPVDAMRRQFWEESAAGKAMMEEVRSWRGGAGGGQPLVTRP